MPLQTEPVVLPSATLTIPAPNSRSHNTPTTSSSNLKIRFTPHLLVPTPPFAQGVSGRKIEDCVEIVVDIGGRVDLGLEIDEDALEWAGEYGGEDVEGLIKKRVRGLFEAVSSGFRCGETSDTRADQIRTFLIWRYQAPESTTLIPTFHLRL